MAGADRDQAPAGGDPELRGAPARAVAGGLRGHGDHAGAGGGQLGHSRRRQRESEGGAGAKVFRRHGAGQQRESGEAGAAPILRGGEGQVDPGGGECAARVGCAGCSGGGPL